MAVAQLDRLECGRQRDERSVQTRVATTDWLDQRVIRRLGCLITGECVTGQGHLDGASWGQIGVVERDVSFRSTAARIGDDRRRVDRGRFRPAGRRKETDRRCADSRLGEIRHGVCLDLPSERRVPVIGSVAAGSTVS